MERYVARAASAYGIAVDVDVVTLPEQILIRDKASESVSNLAVVRATPGIFRLDQLATLKRVLVEIERGLDADAACRQLDAVEASPPRWPWWTRVIGVALFAAGFAPSVAATWGEVGAAAILGIVMGLLSGRHTGPAARGTAAISWRVRDHHVGHNDALGTRREHGGGADCAPRVVHYGTGRHPLGGCC